MSFVNVRKFLHLEHLWLYQVSSGVSYFLFISPSLNDVPLHRSHILLVCIAQEYCMLLSKCYLLSYYFHMYWVLFATQSWPVPVVTFHIYRIFKALPQVSMSEFDTGFYNSVSKSYTENLLWPSRSRGNEGSIFFYRQLLPSFPRSPVDLEAL